MRKGTITIELHFTDHEALEHLKTILEVLTDLREDFGYREDVQDACECADKLLKSMAFRQRSNCTTPGEITELLESNIRIMEVNNRKIDEAMRLPEPPEDLEELHEV